LENASGHPPSITEIDENIKVIFLPRDTSSLIQPMDQGVVATLKSYHLRRTFSQLVQATNDEDNISVEEFWKKYDIKMAIDNIGEAWAEVM
jgi:uncharacterized protein involved in tellurium resistance